MKVKFGRNCVIFEYPHGIPPPPASFANRGAEKTDIETILDADIKRILISKDVAVTPLTAKAMGIEAVVYFFRDDGYMLGAPSELRREAHSTWPHHWTYFYDCPTKQLLPISEYEKFYYQRKSED